MSLETGIAFGLVSMVSFGFLDFCVAISSRRVGGFTNTLWITIVQFLMLLALIPYLFVYGNISVVALIAVILAGLSSAVGAWTFAIGMKKGNASIISPISASFAVITAILGFIFLNEKLTNAQILFIGMIIAGAILVSVNTNDIRRSRGRVHAGVGYGLLSAVSFGLYFFFISVALQTLNWFSTYILVIVPRLIFLLVFGYAIRAKLGIARKEVPFFILMAFLSTIAFLSYNLGASYDYGDIIAPIASSASLMTILLALVLWKERLTPVQVFGIAIGVVGLILISI